MSWLFSYTGYSFFDWWALVHACFWVFVGSTLWAVKHNRYLGFFSCLACSYLWEWLEAVLAPRYPEVWRDSESWWNSWLSDPLMCCLGVLGIWWALDHRKSKEIEP